MSPATPPLAAIEELTVEVAERTVLDRVSLVIDNGSAIGLIGPSGCGKTTTALALLGHLREGMRRRGGTVRVRGTQVFPAPSWLRGRTVAYVPQDPGHTLNPYRRIGAALLDSLPTPPPRREQPAAVAQLLECVGLPTQPSFARRHPHQLSGGQQQRVALALALSRSPALLVLDEPTTGLDVIAKASIVDELRRIHRAGTALLWISHDVDTLTRSVDQVITMHDGRLTDDGPSADQPRSPARAEVSLTTAPRPPSASTPLLSVRALTAEYSRAIPVLHDIDLTLTPGECVAVLGVSGTGKTTLARCLAGLHPPRNGTLLLDGVSVPWEVRRRSRAQRAALQLVAQSPAQALHPRQTVRTALTRPLRLLRGITEHRQLHVEVDRLLQTVLLSPSRADRLPGELSGGERQRVSLARALAAGPRALLCDESTSALDPDTEHEVLDVLERARRDLGLATLLITHSLDVAARADRVVTVAEGRIATQTDVGDAGVLSSLSLSAIPGCAEEHEGR